MKASDQFILRKIADEYLLIPVGEAAVSVKGLIALTESGALIFEKLRGGCTKEELVAALMGEYEVREDMARADTEEFLERMRQYHILLED